MSKCRASFKLTTTYGAAAIHDATISNILPSTIPTSSDTLKELLDKQRRTYRQSLRTSQCYLPRILEIEHLRASASNYHKAVEELDDGIENLENVLAETNEARSIEKVKLSGPVGHPKLNLKVSIGLFADSEGEIKVALIYGVYFYIYPLRSATDIKKMSSRTQATCKAEYDIRVDMKNPSQ